MADIPERDHCVRINGKTFHYLEKAPFTTSGYSWWGVIEHDSKKDKLKCHECGELHDNLSTHIRRHKNDTGTAMTPRDYRVRHNLPMQAPLVNDRIRLARKTEAKRRGFTLTPEIRALGAAKRSVAQAMAPRRIKAAHRNLHAKCEAQVLDALMAYRAEHGAFPTHLQAERALKIYVHDLRVLFGVDSWADFYAIRGWDNPSTQSRRIPHYTKESLAHALIEFYRRTGRVPNATDWKLDPALPKRDTFIRHFGGTAQAHAAAGLGLVYAQARKQSRPQSHAAD